MSIRLSSTTHKSVPMIVLDPVLSEYTITSLLA